MKLKGKRFRKLAYALLVAIGILMGFLFYKSKIMYLRVILILCFISLVAVLFMEKTDFLSYCLLLVFIASISAFLVLPEVSNIEYFVAAIEFEVIIFLLCMFIIVEILNDKKIFHEISRRIIYKFHQSLRKLFYAICVVSTLIASFLEDLSVAIIFGPIIIITCKEMKINATPFLLGMTICINLAATLTPFGSAQNILIVNALDLDFPWFIKHFGVFFIIGTMSTLYLLDKFILSKYLKEREEIIAESENLIREFILYKAKHPEMKQDELSIQKFCEMKNKES